MVTQHNCYYSIVHLTSISFIFLEMRGLLVLLAFFFTGQAHRSWNQRSPRFWHSYSEDFTTPPGWTDTWQEVETLVPKAPSSKLIVEWPNNLKIETNAITSVGLMTERPKLKWKKEKGALYTVMAIDGGIRLLLPQVFLHWMVSDISRYKLYFLTQWNGGMEAEAVQPHPILFLFISKTSLDPPSPPPPPEAFF